MPHDHLMHDDLASAAALQRQLEQKDKQCKADVASLKRKVGLAPFGVAGFPRQGYCLGPLPLSLCLVPCCSVSRCSCHVRGVEAKNSRLTCPQSMGPVQLY